MPAPTTQLKADLKMIGDAIKRADGVPDSIKNLFGELVAWNEAIVEHTGDLDERLNASEAAIDEILEGAGEMISPDTAATLTSSIQHGQMLCAAITALLEGPFAKTMDEIAKKRIAQLVENAQKSFALSNQVITEITARDEDDVEDDVEDEENADGDDGDGDGAAGDVAGDLDVGEEAADEDENVDE